LTLDDPGKTRAVIDAVTDALAKAHDRKDWEVLPVQGAGDRGWD